MRDVVVEAVVITVAVRGAIATGVVDTRVAVVT
jgi:hypothetical protein